MSQNNIDSPLQQTYQPTIQQQAQVHEYSQQQTRVQNQVFGNYEHQLAIQIITKIAFRFHSRQFMKNLIFANISALKNTSNIQLNHNQLATSLPKNNKILIDWPFKDLHYKRHKNQEEQFLYEFVSMCATKIQAKFKAYIVSKRHKKAMQRFRKFVMALRAITKGWKTRRIYNCPKMLQMRQKIKSINQIITEQQQKPDRSAKKLQYLIEDIEYNTKVFQDYFSKLSGNGRWVYEIDKSIVYVKKRPKVNFINSLATDRSDNNYITKQYEIPQQQLGQQKPIKKQRKRQFAKSKVKNRTNENQPINKSQFQIIPSRDIGNNPFDEIPIKAKGNYDYQTMAQMQSSKISEQKDNPKEIQHENQNRQKEKSQKNKTMNEQKKKLQKRQKYDPRKAIEEEKQRKKHIKIETQDNKYLQEKRDNTPLKKPMQPETKTPKHSIQNNKKIVKGNQKSLNQNSQINKSAMVSSDTTVHNKPNKPQKNQSKVINWKKKISEVQNAHSHGNQRAKEQHRSQSPIFIKNNSYIHKIQGNRQSQTLQPNQMQQSKYERSRLHSLIQQRLKKKSEEVKVVSERIDSTQKRQQSTPSMVKEDKYKRIQGNMNKIIQKLADNKQKQVYRPVQQLIETYNNQYSVRYESILPKLGMLSAARSCQHRKNQQSLSESVPVLSQDSIQVLKSLYENIVVTAFWQALSKKQRCFKEFLMN